MKSQPPAMVPVMMAMKVPSSMIPFPQDRRCGVSSSGSRPYLVGPKKALCPPIRKTVSRIIHGSRKNKASRATPIMAISANLVPTTTLRLL